MKVMDEFKVSCLHPVQALKHGGSLAGKESVRIIIVYDERGSEQVSKRKDTLK